MAVEERRGNGTRRVQLLARLSLGMVAFPRIVPRVECFDEPVGGRGDVKSEAV